MNNRTKQRFKFGIGIDIEPVDRFVAYKKNDAFVKKYFTEDEINYCFSDQRSAEHLAGRFAAKESCIKAFGSLLQSCPDWKDIQIVSSSSGAPALCFTDHVKLAINASVSISHGGGVAVAVVHLSAFD